MEVTTTAAIDNSGDKKIAAISLNLLFLVSIFHALWISSKNNYLISQSLHGIRGDQGAQIFIGFFVVILILNFLPCIYANRLFKREQYKRQLIVTIRTFIVFQIIAHALLLVVGGMIDATLC